MKRPALVRHLRRTTRTGSPRPRFGRRYLRVALCRACWLGVTVLALLSLAAPGLTAQVSTAPKVKRSDILAWQQSGGTKMAFEVASIRVPEPGPFLPPSFELGIEDTAIPPGGRFVASFALEDYIEFAYKILPTPNSARFCWRRFHVGQETNTSLSRQKPPATPPRTKCGS
jgi:hypothetical protein